MVLRVNKLLHEPIGGVNLRTQSGAKEEAKKTEETAEEGFGDYTCVGPNEDIPCAFNTLFYLQVVKRGEERVNKTKAEEEEEEESKAEEEEESLRAGVARVVRRVMMKDFFLHSWLRARFGLGVVCNGKDVLFVRVDRTRDEVTTIPVHVSEVLRLDSEEALRYWARFLCCSSTEQFGLAARNLFEVLQLPSRYSYVRALGSGSVASVVEVRDEESQCLLACKLVYNSLFHFVLLTHEARALEMLQGVVGVPRLVSCSEYAVHGDCDDFQIGSYALLTSPVGTPLHEHIRRSRTSGSTSSSGSGTSRRSKSLVGGGEGEAAAAEYERHRLARRVLEEMKPVLCAAHAKGVVHGDIKPDNLVVGSDGQLFLIDWGSATIDGHPIHVPAAQKHLTPFLSDEMLLDTKHVPTAQDDEKALLLTVVAIRESPVAFAPWPYRGCGGEADNRWSRPAHGGWRTTRAHTQNWTSHCSFLFAACENRNRLNCN